jgi:hypothetical protein
MADVGSSRIVPRYFGPARKLECALALGVAKKLTGEDNGPAAL